MFEGSYSVAVSPEGILTLPPAMRRELEIRYETPPCLLAFGVQFLYLCAEEDATPLVRQICDQLKLRYEEDVVRDYLLALRESIAPLPAGDGWRLQCPPHLLELVGHAPGETLTLIGVGGHMELWNKGLFARRRTSLEQQLRAKHTVPAGLLETPICLQKECSLQRGGVPIPRNCGSCISLRLP
ncbi:MAG: hypothetical protein LBJ11_03860 [Oscillospiraceae bacterium]|jgi:DNA-binding transcriptional regulator/RsmH inhibitor MraZ|nr:hypothetical protein [Oscillospiraceae bacterium]